MKERFFSILIISALIWISSGAGTGIRLNGIAFAQKSNIEDILFKKAEALCKKKNYEQALPDLERVLKLNPSHSGAIYYLAVFDIEKGEKDKASKKFEKIVNDPQFGSLARAQLAQMTLENHLQLNIGSIKAYMEGQAFTQAMNSALEALKNSPDNPDLLFLAAYSAALAEEPRYAEAAYRTLENIKQKDIPLNELRQFLDGWFSREHAPREALERLLPLTDPRLHTKYVTEEMKKMLLSLSLTTEYENLMLDDISRAGPDKDSLERELIRFYIENGMHAKGLDLIAKRPIESLEDNLMYIELLTMTSEELKGMLTAQYLESAHPNDMQIQTAWLKAYLKYTERNGIPPKGTDDSGQKIEETAQAKAKILFGNTALSADTRLKALRVGAGVIEADDIERMISEAINIKIEPADLPEALKTAEEIASRGSRSRATRYLEGLLNSYPNEVELQRCLAEQYYLNNESGKAVPLLEEAIISNPDSLRIHMLLADCMVAIGEAVKARDFILNKIAEPDLEPLFKRQLMVKLNQIGFAIEQEPTIPDSPETGNATSTQPADKPEHSETRNENEENNDAPLWKIDSSQ